MTTFKDQLNLANTNELNRLLADMKFGDFVRSMPVTLSKQAPVAGSTSNGNLTTIDVIHDSFAGKTPPPVVKIAVGTFTQADAKQQSSNASH